MRLPLNSKLPQVGTTIFTTMSELAARHGAINLAQGFPDFDPPPKLIERVHTHLKAGKNQYAPMIGAPRLRQQIALKVRRLYGVELDADTQVTVTSGATEAIFCAIHALVRPGDEVIILDPAFDCYAPAVMLAGGQPIHLALQGPNFELPLGALAAALQQRSRLLIINTPHNPSGRVFSARDLQALESLLVGTGCWVLSDEVYEHVVFDGARHESVLRYPALSERSVAVFSFGKTYHATGWKLGYAVAPPALSLELRKVHQYNTFASVHPLQCALADYMEQAPEHDAELAAFYQQKRDEFCSLLQGSGFRLVPSAGTYFQLADYSSVRDIPDQEFAAWLTERAGVAAIPMSVFYRSPPHERLVRFCFAKRSETLEQAAERLTAL